LRKAIGHARTGPLHCRQHLRKRRLIVMRDIPETRYARPPTVSTRDGRGLVENLLARDRLVPSLALS